MFDTLCKVLCTTVNNCGRVNLSTRSMLIHVNAFVNAFGLACERVSNARALYVASGRYCKSTLQLPKVLRPLVYAINIPSR